MQLAAYNQSDKVFQDNNFLRMAHELETESRSASPPHTGRGVHPAPPALSLAFSIERILSEDFGKRERVLDTHTHKGGLFNSSLSPASENSTASVGRTEEKSELPPSEIPIWVFCTRYSARASSGPRRIRSKKSKGSGDQDITDGRESPRSRRIKKKDSKNESKRARTAFTNVQLQRLRDEFTNNRYLTEKRRQDLARDLQLSESQIKIWFQNKRAKMKKSGRRSPLALQLMAHGLYDHRTVPLKDDQTDERPKSSSSL